MSNMLFLAIVIVYTSVGVNLAVSDLEKVTATESLFCRPRTCSNSSSMGLYEDSHQNISVEDALDNLPVEPPDYQHSDCCHECSCIQSICKLEGTCCLATLDHLPTVEESRSVLQMSCSYPQLKPYTKDLIPNAGVAARMLRKCMHKTDLETVDRCEKAKDYDDIVTQVPVVDRKSFISYHNKYCARCNDVDEDNIVFWKARIDCKLGWYNPSNISAVVRDIMDSYACNILYDLPDVPGLTIPKCFEAISACNETGLWKTYDPVIERACLAYTLIYDFKYRNVFCYLCNTDETTAPNTCTHIPGGFEFISFSALLKIPAVEENNAVKQPDFCADNQVFDPVLVSYLVDILRNHYSHCSLQ